MRVAAIDMGTNTFLCLIADVVGGQIQKVLWDGQKVVRLGEGVDRTGEFQPPALKRADACLASFREKIHELKVNQVLAVATSAARDVRNRAELERVAANHGIQYRVISGEEEARLTFCGGVSGINAESATVIDVGGGSTEIVSGNRDGLFFRKSFQVGSVRLTERFVRDYPTPLSQVFELRSCAAQTFQALAQLERSERPQPVVAVAGTPVNLACLELGADFDPERIEGFVLTCAQLDKWVERLAERSLEERRELPGLQSGREDVIVAGAVLLSEAAKALGSEHVIVSTRGIRYGLAQQSAST